VLRKVLIILYILLGGYTCVAQTDSLIAAYNSSTLPDERANLAFLIAKQYYIANPGLFVSYARLGYAAISTKDVAVKANLANLIGVYYRQHGGYDSAAYYYKTGLATAKKINAIELINKMESNLGDLYSAMGKYSEALSYQLPVINSYEHQKGKEADIQRQNTNIGNTYFYMHNYAKALVYYNRAYPGLKDSKSQLAGNLFNSMGVTYGELGNKQKELELLEQSLVIKEATGDSLGIVKTLINMGGAADDRGDKAVAMSYYNRALAIGNAIANKEIVDEIKQNISQTQLKDKGKNAAIAQYKASLKLAKSNGDIRIQKEALAHLYALYDTLHDYTQAYAYIQEYEGLSDTTRSTNYVREIADAETKYETQRALRERDSLHNQRDKLEYESRLHLAAQSRAVHARNLAIGISIGSLAALLLIFGLAWRIRTIRAKTREEQGYTRAIFEGEQAERIRIARDLHDSIGQMLAVVKMRLSSLPGQPHEQVIESADISIKLLDKTIDEVRTISHNLIPEELTFGIVRGLENLCGKISENGAVTVHLVITDEVRAHKFNQQFSLSLYRIVQEVLGNMMKHSGASAINIDMAENAGLIVLKIADNGNGFDTDTINDSKGIGWKNIFARVNLLNGSLDVRSERISGTRIEILVPQ
jgi:two-component system NarL family sensor kinase